MSQKQARREFGLLESLGGLTMRDLGTLGTLSAALGMLSAGGVDALELGPPVYDSGREWLPMVNIRGSNSLHLMKPVAGGWGVACRTRLSDPAPFHRGACTRVVSWQLASRRTTYH